MRSLKPLPAEIFPQVSAQPAQPRPRWQRAGAWSLLILLSLSLGSSAIGQSSSPLSVSSSASPEAKASGPALVLPRRGTFLRQARLVGDVQALKQSYLAPAFSTKLAMLAEDGSVIKKGAVVAKLDIKTLEEELDEQQTELELAKSTLVEHDRSTAADKVRLGTEIERAQAGVDQQALALRQLEQGTRPEELRKLQLKRDLASKALELAKSTLALKEKLAAKGISTQLEVLQARLDLSTKEQDFRVAEAELKQAKIGATSWALKLARLELQKARAQLAWANKNRSLTLEQAALNRQKLVAKQNSVSSRVNLQKQQMQQATMKAPIDGTVVLTKSWTNEGLKRPAVGDDVQEGNAFVSVADLSKVLIRSELDETLLRQVKIGMSCTIELPSMRGKHYAGKISKIGVLAHDRTGRQNTAGLSKVFDLDILPDRQEAAFQPGTSVDIQLPLVQQQQVLLLDRRALLRDGKRHYVILADGSERDVTLGESNQTEVVILKGLGPEDQVRLPEGTAANKAAEQPSKETP